MKCCYIYINNACITQKMRFLYINGFILETCHNIYMESLIILLHGNVNNSKFIKTNPPPPEIRPATPLKCDVFHVWIGVRVCTCFCVLYFACTHVCAFACQPVPVYYMPSSMSVYSTPPYCHVGGIQTGLLFYLCE